MISGSTTPKARYLPQGGRLVHAQKEELYAYAHGESSSEGMVHLEMFLLVDICRNIRGLLLCKSALSDQYAKLTFPRCSAIIHNGSDAVPATYWAIPSVLHEAGLPAGVLSTIYAKPEDMSRVTGALFAHPPVKKIHYSGSTAVGSIIAFLAGKQLKPLLIEIGGKVSSIVYEEANIAHTAQMCAFGEIYVCWPNLHVHRTDCD